MDQTQSREEMEEEEGRVYIMEGIFKAAQARESRTLVLCRHGTTEHKSRYNKEW